jgi:hypothetical protein
MVKEDSIFMRTIIHVRPSGGRVSWEAPVRRILVLGSMVMAAIGAAVVGAQQPPAGPAAPGGGGQGRGGGRGPGFPPVTAAEKVAENLYMIPGQGGNTAAWIMANGVLLVDTKLVNNGQAILVAP